MIEQTLQKLGWSSKKISVYLTLLKLGPSPVRAIAAESGINRGTTYDLLKVLREEGLIAYFQKQTRQYFVAEDPSKLLQAIDDKSSELKQAREMASSVVAQMRTLYKSGGKKPVARMYEGGDGLKNVLSDVLETAGRAKVKQYYAYSAADVRSHIYNSMPRFNKKRIDDGIKVKVIGLQKGGEVHGLDERRWIEKGEISSETYVFIYNGKVAYVSEDSSGEPVGMIIDNEGIYKTEKHIFESLWERLPAE